MRLLFVLYDVSDVSLRGKSIPDVVQHMFRTCDDKAHYRQLNEANSNRIASAKVRAEKRREENAASPTLSAVSSASEKDSEFLAGLRAFSQLDVRELLDQARLVSP